MSRAVQRLANLLDSTLGSGDNEGTLHPTARIRLDVAEDWANASLRPWALVDMPYNSREDVDGALKGWSLASTARSKIYGDIVEQMPQAEKALAKYYQKQFKLPPALAHQMGLYVTDFIYRDYFVFPRGEISNNGPETANNPWPVDLR
jgi:hypothetical protein